MLTVTVRPPIFGCEIWLSALQTCFGPASGRGVVAIGAEHDELLAAVAGHQIARPAGTLQQRGQALDHVVARLMAVVVVDQLEAVEVAHQQAARDLLLLVGGDEHGVNAVEFRPIGHLGQRILRGLFVQALAALFQRSFGRGVVEQQDRPRA